jgi:hypothetical protein
MQTGGKLTRGTPTTRSIKAISRWRHIGMVTTGLPSNCHNDHFKRPARLSRQFPDRPFQFRNAVSFSSEMNLRARLRGVHSRVSSELPSVGHWSGICRMRERKNSSTRSPGSVLFFVSGRVRRFLRRCSLGVGLGVGVVTAGTAGEAVRSGVAVGGAAGSAGVAVGNSVGRGVAIIVPIAAGQFSRVGLFARHWATPEIIATDSESIPTAIAQRASRWVRPCLTSLCLKSISLRISVSRSEAVIISFGGSVESSWISEK